MVERRVSEGMFWALELYLSDELDLLSAAMVDLWVFTVGARRLRWLFDFLDARDLGLDAGEDGRILLVLAERLLRLPRDLSDGSMAVLAVMCCKDYMRNCGLSPANTFRMCMAARDVRGAAAAWKAADSSAALVREIYAEFPARAEGLARIGALNSVKGLGWHEGTVDVWWDLAGYATIWAACLGDAEWTASVAAFRDAAPDVRSRIDVVMDEWEDRAGTVAGRVYTIPRDCLKWETARGRMRQTQSTMGELWHAWAALKGTRYWNATAAEHGYAWTGYDTAGWDAFMEDAFGACDWPDEWSADCQAKSHGEGCLSQVERPYVMQWISRWLPTQMTVIPGCTYTARAWIEEQRAALDAAGALWFDEILAVLDRVGRGYRVAEEPAPAPEPVDPGFAARAAAEPAVNSLTAMFGRVGI